MDRKGEQQTIISEQLWYVSWFAQEFERQLKSKQNAKNGIEHRFRGPDGTLQTLAVTSGNLRVLHKAQAGLVHELRSRGLSRKDIKQIISNK